MNRQITLFDYDFSGVDGNNALQDEDTISVVNNTQIRTDDKKVLSLFSGCGGMDIGFEGGFTCFKRAINNSMHPDWIKNDGDKWVTVKETGFKTVFANDISTRCKGCMGFVF